MKARTPNTFLRIVIGLATSAALIVLGQAFRLLVISEPIGGLRAFNHMVFLAMGVMAAACFGMAWVSIVNLISVWLSGRSKAAR